MCTLFLRHGEPDLARRDSHLEIRAQISCGVGQLVDQATYARPAHSIPTAHIATLALRRKELLNISYSMLL